MTAGPADQHRAGRGRLRASHADREQVIDVLKAAYVQGRLIKDELEERVGRVLAARTCADLAAIISDLPWTAARPRPAPAASARPASAAGWALGGLVPAALITATLSVGNDYIGGVLWVVAVIAMMVWVLAGLLVLRLRVTECLAQAAPRPPGPAGRGPGDRVQPGRRAADSAWSLGLGETEREHAEGQAPPGVWPS